MQKNLNEERGNWRIGHRSLREYPYLDLYCWHSTLSSCLVTLFLYTVDFLIWPGMFYHSCCIRRTRGEEIFHNFPPSFPSELINKKLSRKHGGNGWVSSFLKRKRKLMSFFINKNLSHKKQFLSNFFKKVFQVWHCAFLDSVKSDSALFLNSAKSDLHFLWSLPALTLRYF